MQAFGHCYCCTREFGYSVDAYPEHPPTACWPCRARGGLCLHNLGARTADAGGLPQPFHFSVPHGDVSGAQDPGECVWCLARGMEPRDLVAAGHKRREQL